jgi:1-phosphatidylinositol phosphodiesterase
MKLLSNKLRVINTSSVEITELSIESFYRKDIRLGSMDTLMDEIEYDFRHFPFASYRRNAGEYDGKIMIQVGGRTYASIPDPDPNLLKHSGSFALDGGGQLRYELAVRQRGRFADLTLSFLDNFSTNNWMSRLPDDRLLTQLAIPGTHDSSTFLNALPYVNTQWVWDNFVRQLAEGVRFLDIRVAKNPDGSWMLCHGPVPLAGTFDLVAAALHAFLAANPTETVVVSIKEDNTHFHSSRTNLEIFNDYRGRYPHLRWFTDNRIPRLGEVRGKAVFLRRFGVQPHEQPLGIQASSGWRDESTIDISPHNDQVLVIQDRYESDNPEAKYRWGNDYLGRSSRHNHNVLYLNFFSAVYLGIVGWAPPTPGIPPVIANGYLQFYWDCGPRTRWIDGVNGRLSRQLDYIHTSWPSKARGIIILDYYSSYGGLAWRVIRLNN